jgi:hypothetical protein
MRFEATIYPALGEKNANWADDLNIDRVPDAKGRIRALVTVDDLVKRLNRGLEVHLFRAHPAEPLDPALIMTDAALKSWLDAKVTALKANPTPDPFIKPES